MNGPQTYKALAAALPAKIQETLLIIRDDGMTYKEIPPAFYIACFELQLIKDQNDKGESLKDEDQLQLSRLGEHLVNFCTC